MIATPTKGERDYLRAFGATAIYVAAPPSLAPSRIGVARDLRRVGSMVNLAGLTVAAAYWVGQRRHAERITREIIRGTSELAGGFRNAPVEFVVALIEDAGAKLGIRLAPHDRVMTKTAAGTHTIAAAVATANDMGDLRWFNRTYRELRLANPGLPMPSYPEARARLRSALASRIAGDERTLLRVVFGRD